MIAFNSWQIAHKAAREITKHYLTTFERLPPYLRKLMVVRPPKVDRYASPKVEPPQK